MLKVFASIVLLTMFALVAAGCGGGEATGGESDGNPLRTPHPQNVQVTADDRHAISAVIPLEGGTIEAVATDGTVYTLTIPGNALLQETKITVAPVTAVEGAPVEGGRLAGVDLDPDGLRLYQPATLTINANGVDSAVEAVAFTYHGSGEELHLAPLDSDTSRISLNLLHFSGDFVYIGEGTQLTAGPDTFVPTDWESQLQHAIAELLTAERNAQLRGEEGDPDFADRLEVLVREYYTQVVSPLLPGIASDCTQFEADNGKVTGWARQAEMLGFGESMSQEIGAVTDAVLSGADTCWEEAVEPCVDQDNQAQMSRLISIARMNQLLGGDAGKYDPFDPSLECEGEGGAGWTGTITFTESLSDTTEGEYHSEVTLEVSFDESGGHWLASATETYDNGWGIDGCYHLQTELDTSADGDAAIGFRPADGSPMVWSGDPDSSELVAEVVVQPDGAYRVKFSFTGLHGTVQEFHESRPPCSSESDSWETEYEYYWTPSFDFTDGQTDPDNLNAVSGSYTEGIATFTWDLQR